MKKITGFTIGLMAAGFMQMGHAAATYVETDYTAADASATATLTFSGACKGKIDLAVSELEYYVGFAQENGLVFQDTNYVNTYATLGTAPDTFGFSSYNSTDYATDKFSQSLKKEVLKFSSTAKTSVYVNLPSNAASPVYSTVTCKAGTLVQALTYKNTAGVDQIYGVELNTEASKPSSVLSHENAVVEAPATPDTNYDVPGTYKLAATVSGELYQPSNCTTKADALITAVEYNLTCKAPAAIKVKLQIKGKGADNTVMTTPPAAP